MDEQQKEIEALKHSMKRNKSSKSACVAQISESDSETSIDEVRSAKTESSLTHVKFLRAASVTVKSNDVDLFTYNADTGCNDTLVKSAKSLKSAHQINPTPIFMADDTTIDASAPGPIKPPIPISSVPGLGVPGLPRTYLP